MDGKLPQVINEEREMGKVLKKSYFTSTSKEIWKDYCYFFVVLQPQNIPSIQIPMKSCHNLLYK